MERTCFICRGRDARDTSMVYHELPRRTGAEEFFVFIDPARAEDEIPLRELFRRAVSATRIGHPVRFLLGLVEAADKLPQAPANGAHLSDAMIVVALRRSGELYLLRNRRVVPVCFDAAAGSEGTLEACSARREIEIHGPGKQGDLFEKSAHDQFILEHIAPAPGERTLLLAPSREFVTRNRGILLDSVLFPAFEVPGNGEIILDIGAACPAIHWQSGAPREKVQETRKWGGEMLKSSVPVIAGAAALIVAIMLIFKPFGGNDRPAAEQPETLLTADQAALEAAPAAGVGAAPQVGPAPAAPSAAPRPSPATGDSRARPALAAGWSRKMEGAVTSSPAVCDGRVVFGSRDGYLYAYSTAGERLWRYRAADGIGASPCCHADRIVGADYQGNVFCLEATSGKRFWNYQAGARIVSSPVIEGGEVIVCTMDGRVIALDLDGGQRIWSQTIGEAVWATPAFGSEFVIAASTDGSLVRLSRQGAVIWRVAPGGRLHSSPLVLEERDLVVIGTGDSFLAAHSLKDGSRVWKSAAGSEIRSTPASDGSRIYFGTEKGALLAVDIKGNEIWRRNTGGAIRSRPLILHEAVFVTSYDNMLSAYSALDGTSFGGYRADSQLYSSPTYHDGRIFFGSNAGLLHAPLVTLTEG